MKFGKGSQVSEYDLHLSNNNITKVLYIVLSYCSYCFISYSASCIYSLQYWRPNKIHSFIHSSAKFLGITIDD